MVIELDGAHHYTKEGIESDNNRDIALAELNIKILRFENRLVLENLQGVLEEITSHFSN